MTAAARPGPVIGRRALLGGVLGWSLVGSGCAAARAAAPATGPPTVASLTAARPFYVAHRGGGGDWPEMTGYAYEQASHIPGLAALEISVCRTRDGVLVCSHDPDTVRVTGVSRSIAQQDWSSLASLRVTAAGTRDPRQPSQPFTRFDEVAERYIDRFVLFVEPKVGPAEGPLLQRLQQLHTPERLVWKQQLVSPWFTRAKQAGLTTWGYALDLPPFRQQLTRLAGSPDVDLLGFQVQARRAFAEAVSARAREHGKKTIAWPVASAADRDYVLSYGVSGLMTSTIAELCPRPATKPAGG